jgi:hypothetical protein
VEREERYIAKVRAMSLEDLLALWGQLLVPLQPEGWAPGKAMEYLLLRAFELWGAEVVWPYLGEWDQMDGAVYSDGLLALVESKDWNRPVNAIALAQMRLRLEHRPPGHGVVGLVFGKRGFTDAAKREVLYNPGRNILLWGEDEISVALKHGMCAGLRTKWRYARERGDLKYELKRSDYP